MVAIFGTMTYPLVLVWGGWSLPSDSDVCCWVAVYVVAAQLPLLVPLWPGTEPAEGVSLSHLSCSSFTNWKHLPQCWNGWSMLTQSSGRAPLKVAASTSCHWGKSCQCTPTPHEKWALLNWSLGDCMSNTLDTAGGMILRSRSQLNCSNTVPVHTYPSHVMYTPNLETVAQILYPGHRSWGGTQFFWTCR